MGQTRFASNAPDPQGSAGLSDDHEAVREGRTLFPKSVVAIGDSPRLLVSGHNNPKLGSVVQKGDHKGKAIYHLTLEERATCPSECYMWNSCYGNSMPFARRHKIESVYEFSVKLIVELDQLTKKFADGVHIRLHTLGDFFSVEYVEAWRVALLAFPTVSCFGFTAHEYASDIAGAIIDLQEEFGDQFVIRFSTPEADAMQATVFDGPSDDPDVIMCPAQTKDTECCATCGLCWSEAAADKAIGFLRHGLKRWEPKVEDHQEETYRPIGDINIGAGLGTPNQITTKMPGIQMLDVADLVIDTRYQRVITSKGRSNIRHIVENFDWMHFQPILVSPVEIDGEQKYAVVDGQHRVLAAINHPDVQLVPSAVVNLSADKQAYVFAEINSRIVKVNPLEIFWARYASGDADATQVMDCVDEADLEMSRIIYNCNGDDSYAKAKGKFWSPSSLYAIIKNSSLGHASNALHAASKWSPDAPQAPNAIFIIESLAYYFYTNNITDTAPYIERLSNKCDYFDVVARTKIVCAQTKTKPRTVFATEFMNPAFQGGALAAA